MGTRGPARRVRLRKRWLDQYRSGSINLNELARRAGVSPSTAHRELRRLGIHPARPRGRRAPPEQLVREVVALYQEGMSLRAVARRIGFSAEGVRRLLLRAQVSPRPRHAGDTPRDPAGRPIRLQDFGARLRARRHAAGLSQAALAARCGLHKLTIGALEAGRHIPRWETLVCLTRALGVAPEDLGLQAVPVV